MNREPKYKVWNKRLKQMFSAYIIDTHCGVVNCESLDGKRTTHTFGFIDLVFLEFTGLKDKNGKEICDSDLLAFEAAEWYRSMCAKPTEDYVFEVSQDVTGEWVGAGLCTEWATYCEIVGNIYENPELLDQRLQS